MDGDPSTRATAARLMRVALRPYAPFVSAAAALERATVEPLRQAATARALSLLDRALEARLTSEAVDHVASSALLHDGVERALAGPVADAVADALSEHAVIERIAGRLAATGELDELVRGALGSEATDAIAEQVLESPAAERLAARVIDSRLVDQTVNRLLESDELWLLVDEIARSPSVTAAIGRQSLGLADQFAGVVRDRTERADDRLENALRRIVRRRGSQKLRTEPTM
jgi:hypothetical protein